MLPLEYIIKNLLDDILVNSFYVLNLVKVSFFYPFNPKADASHEPTANFQHGLLIYMYITDIYIYIFIIYIYIYIYIQIRYVDVVGIYACTIIMFVKVSKSC